MDNLRFSLVIPMYNEEKIAADATKVYSEYLDSLYPEQNYEIIFVNDGSNDKSAEIINDFGHPCVKLIGYDVNRGKGCAVRTGVLKASGDIILYTDCDNAYGTDAIGRAIGQLKNTGSDIVIGSRNISADGYSGYTFMRKLMSKIYIKVISLLTGFKHSDSQCGIKCFTRDAAHSIFAECTTDGFAFDLEVLILADMKKLKISEMPVVIINQRQSKSKVNPVSDAIKMINDVLRIKKAHKQK